MYLDDLTLVFAAQETVAVNQPTNLLCVIGILAGNQNNRLHIVQIVFAAVLTQYSLPVLVQSEPIADLHFLDVILVIARHVGASHNDRYFQISLDSATCKIIGVDYIRCGLRRSGKLKSENRFQIIDRLH